MPLRATPILILLLALAVAAIPRPLRRAPALGPTGDVWIVKFMEDRNLRLSDEGRLLGPDGLPVSAWNDLPTQIQGARVGRLFVRPSADLERDRRRGEQRIGRPLRDLGLYARITLPPHWEGDLPSLVRRTVPDAGWIESVWPEPVAEPASLLGATGRTPPGADAIDHDAEAGDAGEQSGGGPSTPDFAHGQGYLGPAPVGIGARHLHAYPGGRGAGVQLIDIEGGWNFGHEDLPAPFLTVGPELPAWRNHGTAVLGQLVGRDDDRGIVGIAPGTEVGGISFVGLGVAAAIDLAAASVGEGDIILIELHAPGPAASEGTGQHGYLPMEWWQDCFDAIALATANGRIVVAAAGNGSQDLDDPRYRGLFDRDVRDSGALLVAAGTPWGHTPEWFTNHGSRIDLHGWGSAIVTTGYGTLHGGTEESAWYTAGFGGTSGAAPMVAGAVACLQSSSRNLWGVTLDPGFIRNLLRDTGTPPSPGGETIGPRPDLARARDALVTGVADLRGRVLAPDGSPVPGARLRVGERSIVADAHGAFRLAIRAGVPGAPPSSNALPPCEMLTILAPAFHPATFPLDVPARAFVRRDFVLEPEPSSSLHGVVRTSTGEPVPQARVEAIPLEGAGPGALTTTDGRGVYTLGPVSQDADYIIAAGPVAGDAPGAIRVALRAGADASIAVPDLILGPAQTFEGGAPGWTAASPWSLGPGGAFSSNAGWSQGDGSYPPEVDIALVSPAVPVPPLPLLAFTHRFETELGYDGACIEVEVDGNGTWTPVTPLRGYPVRNVAALGWEAGFSGRSDGWELALCDLAPLGPFPQGTEVRIRFRFASDASLAGAGWWIDDVALVSLRDGEPSAVPTLPPSSVAGDALIAFPNPFTDELRLVRSGDTALLTVVDAAGRLVQRLSVAAGTAVWDGRDGSGQAVPSGVYWIVPSARAGLATRPPLRVVRLR